MGPFADLSTLESVAAPLLLAFNVGIGLLGGYLVARRRAAPGSNEPAAIDPARQTKSPPIDDRQIAARECHDLRFDAEASISRLEALATHMTDRVADHSERVEAINLTLASDSHHATHSPRTIAEAATKLMDANGRLQAELHEARQALAEQSEKLQMQRREALTDSLTGLANRRAFDLELQSQLARAPEYRPRELLMMVDIDHFKQINDRFGHPQGDLVLQKVAGILRDAAVAADAFVARFGGEEFMLLWPAMDEQAATSCADRLRHAVESLKVFHQEQPVRVTVSLGCARIETNDSSESLIARADQALYAAKRAGRNCVVHHKNHSCMPPAHDAEPMVAIQTPIKMPNLPLTGREPGDALTFERRRYPPRAYTGTHWITPYVEGQWPSEDEFEAVEGIDVSAGGFSFACASKPDCESFIVRFNVSGELRYLLAKISNCGPLAGRPGRLRIGCQFLGRLEPGDHPQQPGPVDAEDFAAFSQV